MSPDPPPITWYYFEHGRTYSVPLGLHPQLSDAVWARLTCHCVLVSPLRLSSFCALLSVLTQPEVFSFFPTVNSGGYPTPRAHSRFPLAALPGFNAT